MRTVKLLICLCALLSLLPVRASADVRFTADGAADADCVYVAGAPDFAPVEYFDAGSETYRGACPAFLRLVSERTGLAFAYIRAGERDRRETLGRNLQVDLLFATSAETELLELADETALLFRVMRDGAPTDVYCAFTAVAREEDRAAIRAVAGSLTKDETAQLLTADGAQGSLQRKYVAVLIVLGVALVLALLAADVLLVLFLKQKRQKTKSALLDADTQIGNRSYFVHMFRTSVPDQIREICYIVCFAFDVEWIDNSCGADESERVVRYAADVIAKRMSDQEFCARIGSGAFAAALYAGGVERAEGRVEEILRVLNGYSGMCRNEEKNVLFRAGICALAMDDRDPEQAIFHAEQAYRLAVEEKNAYVFADHDVLYDQQVRASIREQAAEALEQRAFTPYVQFIVRSTDGALCGGELLSRWQNRLYGLLNPGAYLPILRNIGLIGAHDLLMLEEACRLLQDWAARGRDWFLACNLTGVTIADGALMDKVLSTAARYEFSGERLIIEVTEDIPEEDKENVRRNVARLKEAGFRIALDDFSSGYTSVADLYEYGADLVKLNRQMILDAERDQNAAAVLAEMTKLCHRLHVEMLAEGVETETQARRVRAASCDYIQGFYYARPLPLRELDGFAGQYAPQQP